MGRPAFLATVAGQVTPQLCELDDREQFRVGIDLILAGTTTPLIGRRRCRLSC
jgi:hypothetical protein